MAKKENVIGKLIKKYRNLENLSQLELADKINVSKGTIESYEYGIFSPPIEKLKLLHKVLDIPFMEFFPDVFPTKGYISKMEEKITKYGSAIEAIEKHPELLNVIRLYSEHHNEIKTDTVLKLLSAFNKPGKGRKK